MYFGSQLLLLTIVARMTTPETLGEFAYALSVTGPIIVLSQLNARAFLVTDAVRQFRFKDYCITRFVTSGVAVAAIVLVAALSDLAPSGATLLVLVGLYKCADSLSDIYRAVLIEREATSGIAFSAAAHGVLAVLAMAVGLLVTGKAVVGAAGIVLLWTVLLVAYDIPAARRLSRPQYPGRAQVWAVIKACFPLGLVMALLSLRINLPAYFIKVEYGTAQVGLYMAVAYFVLIGNLVSASLGHAVAPRLARHYVSGNHTPFWHMIRKLLIVAMIAGAIGVGVVALFGDRILTLLYGPEFQAQKESFIWVMLAVAVGYAMQFLGLGLTIARLFRYQLFANVVGILTTFLLSYYLIPQAGVNGGALALLGGTAVVLLLYAVAVWAKVDPRKAREVAPDQQRPCPS